MTLPVTYTPPTASIAHFPGDGSAPAMLDRLVDDLLDGVAGATPEAVRAKMAGAESAPPEPADQVLLARGTEDVVKAVAGALKVRAHDLADTVPVDLARRLRDCVSITEFGAIEGGGAEDFGLTCQRAIARVGDPLTTIRGLKIPPGRWQHASGLVFGAPDVRVGDPTPILFICEGDLVYTGHGTAINLTGNGWGVDAYIKSLLGAGIVAEGTQNGPEENIGIRVGPNSGVQLRVGSVRRFNKNVLGDGCYFCTIRIGYSVETIFALQLRQCTIPQTAYAAANNMIEFGTLGGAYTAPGATFAAARLLTAKYGLHLDLTAQGNRIVGGGIEYCCRDDDSWAIHCEGPYNDIFAYVEGAYGQGGLVHNAGLECRVITNGQNSQNLQGYAQRITGPGSTLGPIAHQGIPSQDAPYFAPHQGQAPTYAHPTTRFTGLSKYVAEEPLESSKTLLFNLLTTYPAAAYVITGNGSAADRTDLPYPSPVVPHFNSRVQELTVGASATTWFTVGPVPLGAAPPDWHTLAWWMQRVSGRLSVTAFVLDQTLINVLGKFNTALGDGEWHHIERPVRTAGATSIYLRWGVRNFTTGETGGVLRVFNPVLTRYMDRFDRQEVYFNGVHDGYPVVGTNVVNPTLVTAGWMPALVTSNPTAQNELTIGGRHMVEIADVSLSNVVNKFLGVTRGQEFKVFNSTTTQVTVTTLAGLRANVAIPGGAIVPFFTKDGVNFFRSG